MNKTIKQELVWILIVATFVLGFFLLQGTITGYVTLDETQSTVLTDIQINAQTPISPTLEITIPIKQLTTTTPNLTYGYIQIKPITENYTYIDISFKIRTPWISANKIDKEEIALYIFNKTWKQLPTLIEKETTEFTYYKSRTTELGLFAIAKAPEKLHIEEPAPSIAKPSGLIPILVLIIILLSVVLIIELFRLFKHKLRELLTTLSLIIIILEIALQQPITKEIILYGLIPVSIIISVIAIILNILLNKLRNHKAYPYIRNLVISLLIILIIILLVTTTYTKEIIIYLILPLLIITVLISSIITFSLNKFRKLSKKESKKIKKRNLKKVNIKNAKNKK